MDLFDLTIGDRAPGPSVPPAQRTVCTSASGTSHPGASAQSRDSSSFSSGALPSLPSSSKSQSCHFSMSLDVPFIPTACLALSPLSWVTSGTFKLPDQYPAASPARYTEAGMIFKISHQMMSFLCPNPPTRACVQVWDGDSGP